MILHIQLLLLFVSASSCVELEADMCLNGEHETQCCYDTYCPEVGDGSFLPSDLSGKCEDLLQSLILSWSGCTGEGCCSEWCQCFLGYSFYRDCGQPRVWSQEGRLDNPAADFYTDSWSCHSANQSAVAWRHDHIDCGETRSSASKHHLLARHLTYHLG